MIISDKADDNNNTHNSAPHGIISRLKILLDKVIAQCTDDNGLVDYVKARTVEQYPIFEDAVCQLQGML
jgi:hypothetical protein